MGYVKEPKGINLIVSSRPVTEKDLKKISEIINYYKATGKKMRVAKSKKKVSLISSTKKKILA
jgi:hypothetical protein